MTSEEYAELIDDYEKGIMVEPGEDLTSYIKRMRTDKANGGRMSLSFGSNRQQPMGGGEGITNTKVAGGIDQNILIEEVVKEFIRKYKRKPRSIEEIKIFYQNEMGTANRGQNKDMRMAEYKPGDYNADKYDPMMVEEYEKYKYDANEQGQPIMEIDQFIEMQRAGVKSGGLPGILGV